MIDFRYFLVSVVAIFFALAIGIVLGSGPLEGNINGIVQGTNQQLAQEKKNLQNQIVTLQAAFDASQRYAGTTAPLTLAGQLGNRDIAVVVMPQASSGQVSAVTAALNLSGASVTGVFRLTSDWSDPTKQDQLGRLADTLGKGPQDSNASVAAGQLLADAIITSSPDLNAQGQPRVDPHGADVLAALDSAGFLQVNDPRQIHRATSAIIISPNATPDVTVTDTFLPLVEGLQKDGDAAVVSGGPPASETGGLIAEIRGSDLASTISTVDDLDLPMGAPTSALAVVSRIGGQVGQYGIHTGATQVVPPVPVH